jgi:hypothetical protein
MTEAKASLRSRYGPAVSTILLVLLAVLVLLAGPLLYISNVITEEDAFVSVADKAIAHPEARQGVAEVATATMLEVITTDETLTADLPPQVRTFVVPATRLATTQLTDAAFRLLDTEVAVDARQSALREVHRQFTADESEITIDMGAVLVRTSRDLGGPALGAGVAKVMTGSDVGRFTLAEEDGENSSLLLVTQGVPAAGGLLALLALGCLIGAAIMAPNRRIALVRAGLFLSGSALISVLVVSTILFALLGAFSEQRANVGLAVAEVVSADYAQFQRGLIVNGLILAVVGVLLGNHPAAQVLRSLPRSLWNHDGEIVGRIADSIRANPAAARLLVWLSLVIILVVWSTPTWRVLVTLLVIVAVAQRIIWGVTATSAGAAAFRSRFSIDEQPEPVAAESRIRVNVGILTIVAFLLWPGWSLATTLVFATVGSLLQALLDARTALSTFRSSSTVVESAGEHAAEGSQRRWLVATAVVALAASAGVWSTTNSAAAQTADQGCNGHVELCGRTIDEVVFAGSHNAMSSNALGWQLAMQDGDMITQLDHGIRALLIDALYWHAEGRLDGDEAADDAAATVEAALGDDQPRAGTWLCHGFCALGATDLTSGLSDINIWLDENPNEALLVIVQDEISTEDLEAAFSDSGLLDRAFVHQPGTPFPTLGELVDLDQRVLVYGENQGEPGTWFQNGFDAAFTETPYTFAVPSDFSCAPNRGVDSNPLFLINHWITTGIPVREAAISINSRDALLERVRECEAERGRLPTILATDFVETGDLIAVVEGLNLELAADR